MQRHRKKRKHHVQHPREKRGRAEKNSQGQNDSSERPRLGGHSRTLGLNTQYRPLSQQRINALEPISLPKTLQSPVYKGHNIYSSIRTDSVAAAAQPKLLGRENPRAGLGVPEAKSVSGSEDYGWNLKNIIGSWDERAPDPLDNYKYITDPSKRERQYYIDKALGRTRYPDGLYTDESGNWYDKDQKRIITLTPKEEAERLLEGARNTKAPSLRDIYEQSKGLIDVGTRGVISSERMDDFFFGKRPDGPTAAGFKQPVENENRFGYNSGGTIAKSSNRYGSSNSFEISDPYEYAYRGNNPEIDNKQPDADEEKKKEIGDRMRGTKPRFIHSAGNRLQMEKPPVPTPTPGGGGGGADAAEGLVITEADIQYRTALRGEDAKRYDEARAAAGLPPVIPRPQVPVDTKVRVTTPSDLKRPVPSTPVQGGAAGPAPAPAEGQLPAPIVGPRPGGFLPSSSQVQPSGGQSSQPTSQPGIEMAPIPRLAPPPGDVQEATPQKEKKRKEKKTEDPEVEDLDYINSAIARFEAKLDRLPRSAPNAREKRGEYNDKITYWLGRKINVLKKTKRKKQPLLRSPPKGEEKKLTAAIQLLSPPKVLKQKTPEKKEDKKNIEDEELYQDIKSALEDKPEDLKIVYERFLRQFNTETDAERLIHYTRIKKAIIENVSLGDKSLLDDVRVTAFSLMTIADLLFLQLNINPQKALSEIFNILKELDGKGIAKMIFLEAFRQVALAEGKETFLTQEQQDTVVRVLDGGLVEMLTRAYIMLDNVPFPTHEERQDMFYYFSLILHLARRYLQTPFLNNLTNVEFRSAISAISSETIDEMKDSRREARLEGPSMSAAERESKWQPIVDPYILDHEIKESKASIDIVKDFLAEPQIRDHERNVTRRGSVLADDFLNDEDLIDINLDGDSDSADGLEAKDLEGALLTDFIQDEKRFFEEKKRSQSAASKIISGFRTIPTSIRRGWRNIESKTITPALSKVVDGILNLFIGRGDYPTVPDRIWNTGRSELIRYRDAQNRVHVEERPGSRPYGRPYVEFKDSDVKTIRRKEAEKRRKEFKTPESKTRPSSDESPIDEEYLERLRALVQNTPGNAARGPFPIIPPSPDELTEEHLGLLRGLVPTPGGGARGLIPTIRGPSTPEDDEKEEEEEEEDDEEEEEWGLGLFNVDVEPPPGPPDDGPPEPPDGDEGAALLPREPINLPNALMNRIMRSKILLVFLAIASYWTANWLLNDSLPSPFKDTFFKIIKAFWKKKQKEKMTDGRSRANLIKDIEGAVKRAEVIFKEDEKRVLLMEELNKQLREAKKAKNRRLVLELTLRLAQLQNEHNLALFTLKTLQAFALAGITALANADVEREGSARDVLIKSLHETKTKINAETDRLEIDISNLSQRILMEQDDVIRRTLEEQRDRMQKQLTEENEHLSVITSAENDLKHMDYLNTSYIMIPTLNYTETKAHRDILNSQIASNSRTIATITAEMDAGGIGRPMGEALIKNLQTQSANLSTLLNDLDLKQEIDKAFAHRRAHPDEDESETGDGDEPAEDDGVPEDGGGPEGDDGRGENLNIPKAGEDYVTKTWRETTKNYYMNPSSKASESSLGPILLETFRKSMGIFEDIKDWEDSVRWDAMRKVRELRSRQKLPSIYDMNVYLGSKIPMLLSDGSNENYNRMQKIFDHTVLNVSRGVSLNIAFEKAKGVKSKPQKHWQAFYGQKNIENGCVTAGGSLFIGRIPNTWKYLKSHKPLSPLDDVAKAVQAGKVKVSSLYTKAKGRKDLINWIRLLDINLVIEDTE